MLWMRRKVKGLQQALDLSCWDVRGAFIFSVVHWGSFEGKSEHCAGWSPSLLIIIHFCSVCFEILPELKAIKS